MPERLHWNTVSPMLKSALTRLMSCDLFQSFRLVGGTSLSLQLGHRISEDIDLFTDALYDTVDFRAIEAYLKTTFSYVHEFSGSLVGTGKSYLVGSGEKNAVKLDLFYTEPFILPALIAGPCRLASLEEIIAMKIDIIQRGGRKKDFWDLHELLENYSPRQMIDLHARRYPYNHDEPVIRTNFVNFADADGDFDPVCLKGKYWELIKLDIVDSLKR